MPVYPHVHAIQVDLLVTRTPTRSYNNVLDSDLGGRCTVPAFPKCVDVRGNGTFVFRQRTFGQGWSLSVQTRVWDRGQLLQKHGAQIKN